MFIAECEAGSPHLLEAEARWGRGYVRLARGDIEGALADTERAVDLGRAAKVPEVLGHVLGASILACEALGRVDQARRLRARSLGVARLTGRAEQSASELGPAGVGGPYAEPVRS